MQPRKTWKQYYSVDNIKTVVEVIALHAIVTGASSLDRTVSFSDV
jgi:hypothetical protein